MTKHIIVPFDGSSASVRAHGVATALAARLGDCELELLAVVADACDAREIRENAAHRCLHEPVIVVWRDDPAAVIAGSANARDAIVCMATHGRGRTAALLGSVAKDVLRRSHEPLILVGPECERDWLHEPAHVLTCWAGVESSAILPHAKCWAERLGAELWLELVFHPLDALAAEHPDAVLASAKELLGSARVHRRSDASGYPAGAIVAIARGLPATLIAMTTHARTGVVRTVLGSVAMDVVRHAPCPVLVVKGC
jgi:nucleotide-binding universal stress UspA family protein